MTDFPPRSCTSLAGNLVEAYLAGIRAAVFKELKFLITL
jgi:hypothetical protein